MLGYERTYAEVDLDAISHNIAAVRRRAAGAYPVGVLLFSNVYGVLGRTEGYEEVLHEWKEG